MFIPLRALAVDGKIYTHLETGLNHEIASGKVKPAPPVPPVKKVVDTTGAGDYYAAGFLYGLTCGYSLEKCSIIGSILASNVIQVVGTTLSKKKWDEIKLNIEALLQA